MTTETERESIAARWLIEQDDPDFSDEQQEELVRWIMESVDNCRTYLRLVRAWRWAVVLHRAEPPVIHRKIAAEGASSRRAQVDRRLGSVLRAHRLEAGLTQAELADLCGMRASEISQIEAGTRTLTLVAAYILARGLKVPATRLVSQLEQTLRGKAPRKRKAR